MILADSLCALGRFAEATTEYEAIIQHRGTVPRLPDGSSAVARASAQLGWLHVDAARNGIDSTLNINAGIVAFRRAEADSPETISVQVGLSVLYRWGGKFTAALDAARRAIELSGGGDCDALFQAGLALTELGRVDEALTELERALVGTTGDDIALRQEVLTAMLMAHHQLGDTERCKELVAQLGDAGLGDYRVINVRGAIAAQEEGWAEAEEHFRSGLRLQPHDAVLSTNLARAQVKQGHASEGLPSLRAAAARWRDVPLTEAVRIMDAALLTTFEVDGPEAAREYEEDLLGNLAENPDLRAMAIAAFRERKHEVFASHAAAELSRLTTETAPSNVLQLDVLRSRVAGLRALLGQRDTLEEDIKVFLKDPASRVLFGFECVNILVEHPFGSEFRADFVLEFPYQRYTLVELESSHHKLYTSKGQQSAPLTHAKQQVEDWQLWIEENNPYAQRTLPGCASPEGLVIIGRSHELGAANRARLIRSNTNSRGFLTVQTYDDLLDAAMVRLRNLQRLLGEDPPSA